MSRHGSPCTTATPTVPWPMTQRMPIPGLPQTQGISANKANAASHMTPPEISLIGSAEALLDRQRLPARTIPKPLYP